MYISPRTKRFVLTHLSNGKVIIIPNTNHQIKKKVKLILSVGAVLSGVLEALPRLK